MYIKAFLQKLFLAGIAFYLINVTILYFFDILPLTSKFHIMHLFFITINSGALVILSKIFQKNKDIIGMSFLLISTILTIIVFIIGELNFSEGLAMLKWNYFALYMAYLFCITFIIGQKLNQIKF